MIWFEFCQINSNQFFILCHGKTLRCVNLQKNEIRSWLQINDLNYSRRHSNCIMMIVLYLCFVLINNSQQSEFQLKYLDTRYHVTIMANILMDNQHSYSITIYQVSTLQYLHMISYPTSTSLKPHVIICQLCNVPLTALTKYADYQLILVII